MAPTARSPQDNKFQTGTQDVSGQDAQKGAAIILQENVKVLREWNEKRRRFENVARPENYRGKTGEREYDRASIFSENQKAHFALMSTAQKLLNRARNAPKDRARSRSGSHGESRVASRSTTPNSRKDSRGGGGDTDDGEDEEEPTGVVMLHSVVGHRDLGVSMHSMRWDQTAHDYLIRPHTSHNDVFTTANPSVPAAAATSPLGRSFRATDTGRAGGARPETAALGRPFARHHWMHHSRVAPAPPENQQIFSARQQRETLSGEGTSAPETLLPPAAKGSGRYGTGELGGADRKRPSLKPRTDRPRTSLPVVMRMVSAGTVAPVATLSGIQQRQQQLAATGGRPRAATATQGGRGGQTMRRGIAQPVEEVDLDPLFKKYCETLKRCLGGRE
jgi:hypothetical protein